MKVFVLVFITVLFLGCGVETSSSAGKLSSTTTDTTDTGTDTNSSDTNTTDSTDGSGGTTIVIDDASSAGFSQTDAENDPNACIINDTFSVIDDSSFDPNAAADAQNGLQITSQYAYSTDLEATKVVLYYPQITSTLQNQLIHVYEESYTLSFDKAWSSSSSTRVYVRTPKDVFGAYSCYRYDLASVSDNSITKTKVYR